MDETTKKRYQPLGTRLKETLNDLEDLLSYEDMRQLLCNIVMVYNPPRSRPSVLLLGERG